MSGALGPDGVATALVGMHPFLFSTIVAMDCPEAHVDLELLLVGFLLASAPSACEESALAFDFVFFPFINISRFVSVANIRPYISFPLH